MNRSGWMWILGIAAALFLLNGLWGRPDKPVGEPGPPSTSVGDKETGQSESPGKAGANSDWRSLLGGGSGTPPQDGKSGNNSPSGYSLTIPSDPQAHYYVLEKGGTATRPNPGH